MHTVSAHSEGQPHLRHTDGLSEMEELRQAYAVTLPDKLQALASAVNDATTAQADAAALRQAVSLAHRLRGTAGSYEFHDISRTGGAIEDILRSWADADAVQRAMLSQRLAELLLQLKHSILENGAYSEYAAPQTSCQIKVLVVDERPEFGDRLRGLDGVTLAWTTTADQAITQIGAGGVNVVIMDPHWGGSEGGVRLALELRAASKDPVPLLIISDSGAVEDHATAIYLGAAQSLRRSAPVEAWAGAIRSAIAGQIASRPHILVVDDDPEFAAFARATIESAGMRVTLLADPTAVPETLARENPELLLLDVNMPAINGFDLCRKLRLDPRWQELSILFLTARTDPASRVAAFEVGGDDYIPKPVVTVELLARIRARIERWRLLRERADRDALTGLTLRRRFAQTLDCALAECATTGTPLSLLLLDLDRFKSINDRHGHLAGDQVLARFGALLSSRFRRCDLRGRWGGEEFVLALPGVDGVAAASAASRALEEFRELDFAGNDGRLFKVSFSGGVAMYPWDGATHEALLGCADRRLYEAKTAGRGRVLFGGTSALAAGES